MNQSEEACTVVVKVLDRIKSSVNVHAANRAAREPILATTLNGGGLNPSWKTLHLVLSFYRCESLIKRYYSNKLDEARDTKEVAVHDWSGNATLEAVDSERADSSNRYPFLWDEEYRRSNVASVFDSLTRDEDFAYDPKRVNEQIKHYIRSASASSSKNIMQLMDDEQFDNGDGLLDETYYCNVAELMLLHVKANTTTVVSKVPASLTWKDKVLFL
ncbi:hypothetical protein MAM1_0896d11343, partial [Mucor ambiguus]